MEDFSETFPVDPEKYPNQKIFIGNTGPEEGPAQSVIEAARAKEAAKRDGEFSDIISKALIVRLYAEWDERFRHEIAREFDAKAKDVKSDLIGDIRLVRHWIVHNKSVVQDDVTKITTLPWALTSGEELYVSSKMFQQLMDCLNNMQVRITT